MRYMAGLLGVSCLAGVLLSRAQSPVSPVVPIASQAAPLKLEIVETSLVESQLGGIMMDPLQCDGDGNIYIRFYQEGERRAPIKKFDTQGNRQATFSLEAVTEWDASELTAMYFSVNARGELHQIAWSEDLYVLTFNKDGSYKRRAKIEPLIIPAQVAEFASGEFLITGRKYEGKREDGTNLIEPFTGIFDSSGKLIKRLTFQDDQEIQKAVERGDSNFVNPLIPGTNRAISMGMAVTGEDGNVYVMRRTVPAVIYAVSSAGEVVRKLAVDPGDPGMMPSIMQLSKGRVAILFRSDATKEQIVKVVDSQSGEELVTYDANSLGPTLACYSGGQRFTFLSTRKGHLSLDHAEPR